MTATLVEITPRSTDTEPATDEVTFFDDLEEATAEAKTGCGDSNPYH